MSKPLQLLFFDSLYIIDPCFSFHLLIVSDIVKFWFVFLLESPVLISMNNCRTDYLYIEIDFIVYLVEQKR